MEFPEVHAGGEADAVIVLQMHRLPRRHVDQVGVPLLRHGLNHPQRVAVMAGVIADRSFHRVCLLR